MVGKMSGRRLARRCQCGRESRRARALFGSASSLPHRRVELWSARPRVASFMRTSGRSEGRRRRSWLGAPYSDRSDSEYSCTGGAPTKAKPRPPPTASLRPSERPQVLLNEAACGRANHSSTLRCGALLAEPKSGRARRLSLPLWHRRASRLPDIFPSMRGQAQPEPTAL